MNTGQTLLTMGALILLSVTLLNFNRRMVDIDQALDHNRFRLEALSVVTSHMEQASQYFFDEASTDVTNESRLVDFVEANRLGAEGNDSGEIDDIDDLNGSAVADTGRSGVIYTVQYEIDYVTLAGDSIVRSSVKTYHKRLTVRAFDNFNPPLISRVSPVDGSTVRDTVELSTIISYWFYN